MKIEIPVRSWSFIIWSGKYGEKINNPYKYLLPILIPPFGVLGGEFKIIKCEYSKKYVDI